MTSASEKPTAASAAATGDGQLIRMEDAAEMLDVRREKIYELASRGVPIGDQVVKLRVVVTGPRRVRTTREWCREYLDTCTRLWHALAQQKQADRKAAGARSTKLAVGDRAARKGLKQLGAS